MDEDIVSQYKIRQLKDQNRAFSSEPRLIIYLFILNTKEFDCILFEYLVNIKTKTKF